MPKLSIIAFALACSCGGRVEYEVEPAAELPACEPLSCADGDDQLFECPEHVIEGFARLLGCEPPPPPRCRRADGEPCPPAPWE